MKRKTLWWLAGTGVVMAAAVGAAAWHFFGEKDYRNRVVVVSAEAKKVADGNTAFALDLYGRLKDQEKGNMVFSPYSVSSAMAMAWAGARGNTEAQMAKTLHFTLPQASLHPAYAELREAIQAAQARGKVELLAANSLWPQSGREFQPEFLRTCTKFYGSKVTPVDYASATDKACGKINAWVSEQTRGKIPSVVERFSSLTRLVLVNAVYFKGKWEHEFKPTDTRQDGEFFVDAVRTVRTPMMSLHGGFKLAERDDLQVIELPYKGGRVSMLVLLPAKKDGLPALEKVLTPQNLAKWTADMALAYLPVDLPKFTMEKPVDLGGALRALGMPDAFSVQADFSGMDGTHWLYVSEVAHKAVIEVDESGTMAAARSGVVLSAKCAITTLFRADHPFIFIIRENATGSILFIGRVTDPTAK